MYNGVALHRAVYRMKTQVEEIRVQMGAVISHAVKSNADSAQFPVRHGFSLPFCFYILGVLNLRFGVDSVEITLL